MFRERLDEASKSLAQGVSRRAVVGGLVSGAVLGWLRPVRAMAQFGASCYNACKAQCTGADGSLNMVCFRSCVNSDPMNCGRCGNVCASGVCANGQCITGPDRVTIASIRAAVAAIAGGGTDVPLSPGGTIRMRRTFVNSVHTQTEIVRNGYTTLLRIYSGSQITEYSDADKDGFYERVFQTTGSSTTYYGSDQWFSPATHQLQKSVVQNWGPGFVNVNIQQVGSTGQLNTVASYTVTGPSTDLSDSAFYQGGQCSDSYCADQSALRDLSYQAITDGVNCLDNALGRTSALSDKLLTLTDSLDNFQISYDVSCKPQDFFRQQDTLATTIPLLGTVRTYVNSRTFCQGASETPDAALTRQKATLFHEAIHATGVPPEGDLESDIVARQEVYQTYACEKFCFFEEDSNRCVCSTCLGVSYCDQSCDGQGGCSYATPDINPDGCDQCEGGECKKPKKLFSCDSEGECFWNCPGNQVVIDGVCTDDQCGAGSHRCPGGTPLQDGCCTDLAAVCIQYRGISAACCRPGESGTAEGCEMYDIPLVCCS